MELKDLLYVKEEAIAIITLNRPDRLNALSGRLRDELIQVFDDIEQDSAIRAVIVTGSPRRDGKPCFSAGGDIKEMAEMKTSAQMKALGTPEEAIMKLLWAAGENRDLRQFAFNRLQALTRPTIAAIDGICTAGGLEIALCCDLRIAAETAQISDLHMKTLGILGGGGLQTWLPRIVGIAKAKEIIWTCEPMDGKEAWRIGLVNRVVPSDRLMAEAKAMAKRMAQWSPFGMKLSKLVLNASLAQTPYESLRFCGACEAVQRYLSRSEVVGAFETFATKK